jgi:hypothetical protein
VGSSLKNGLMVLLRISLELLQQILKIGCYDGGGRAEQPVYIVEPSARTSRLRSLVKVTATLRVTVFPHLSCLCGVNLHRSGAKLHRLRPAAHHHTAGKNMAISLVDSNMVGTLEISLYISTY